MSRKVHRHPATPRPARAIERDRGMRDAFDLDPNDVFARESRTESTPRAFAARERVDDAEGFLRDAPTVDARDADADAFVDAARVVVNAEIDAIAFEHVWNREKFFVEVVGEGRGKIASAARRRRLVRRLRRRLLVRRAHRARDNSQTRLHRSRRAGVGRGWGVFID